jgi:hypothetical protein
VLSSSFLIFGDIKKIRVIAHAPPLIPPKGGRRIKGISRCLLSYDNLPIVSKFLVPDDFYLGMINRDFGLDFR